VSRPTWGQTLSGQRITIGENRIVEMSADDANCLIPDGWTKLAEWVQGFTQEEDVSFKKIVADYEKNSGNTIDYSIVPAGAHGTNEGRSQARNQLSAGGSEIRTLGPP
jgi:hypothetical protein